RDTVHPPDEELIQLAKAATNGEKFEALWRGDWEKLGYPSQSEADLALLSILGFWTRGDIFKMEELFKKSKLGNRRKWDKPYGRLTLQQAVTGLKTFYEPDPSTRANRPFHDLSGSSRLSQDKNTRSLSATEPLIKQEVPIHAEGTSTSTRANRL